MEIKKNIRETVPFFFISDMNISLTFYLDKLGFKIVNQWIPQDRIMWCRLENDGGIIMLQEHHKMETGLMKEEGKVGIGVSISFNCEDALSLYHDFQSKGANPTEPFVGNGMWVTNVTDPDGYNLSFQSMTDIEEETVYSDWKRKDT